MTGFNVFSTGDTQIRLRGLRIDLEKGPSLDAVEVRMDTWNHWLLIARTMTEEAEAAHARVLAAHEQGQNEALARALEEEFRAALVAISAMAFTFDALYASVKEHLPPHPAEVAWERNRTARYKRIAETFRGAYRARPESVRQLQQALEQVFRFRDWAVHPPARCRQAEMREDIGRRVEWRFVAFSASNAATALRATSEVIEALIRVADRAPEELRAWTASCRGRFAAAAGYEVQDLPEASVVVERSDGTTPRG